MAENLLVPAIDQGGWYGWCVRSRRAAKIQNKKDFEEYRKAKSFPKELIHKSIRDKVWLTFLRGDYDTAVFQAFKEVEVTVRSAAGLSEKEIGTKLMRKAFDPETGTLSDKSQEFGERDALAHLFAGAIGSYKNPQSHRTVEIKDSNEAIEMILLATQSCKTSRNCTKRFELSPRWCTIYLAYSYIKKSVVVISCLPSSLMAMSRLLLVSRVLPSDWYCTCSTKVCGSLTASEALLLTRVILL